MAGPADARRCSVVAQDESRRYSVEILVGSLGPIREGLDQELTSDEGPVPGLAQAAEDFLAVPAAAQCVDADLESLDLGTQLLGEVQVVR